MNLVRLTITFILTGGSFGGLMAAIFTMTFGISMGAMVGVASGILFGSAITLFVALLSVRMRVKGDFESEPVLWQGPANHFMRGEARGGWLVLTPTRLAFRPHSLNLQNQRIDIARQYIRVAQPGRALGFLSNRLQVVLVDGRAETFVVQGQKRWVQQLATSTIAPL
jgi:predicted acylesterase/phospholipase RssA